MSWFNIFGAIADAVAKPMMEWQKRKTLKAELEAKLLEKEAEAKLKMIDARVELAKQGQRIEADWDINAQKQMQNSWKDEYLLFLLTLPIIGSFIPTVQDYVVTGWGYVGKAPEWYVVSFLGIVAATFGLRWLIRPLIERRRRDA
ncbi:hypothetical protein [Hydrogenimonas sp.]